MQVVLWASSFWVYLMVFWARSSRRQTRDQSISLVPGGTARGEERRRQAGRQAGLGIRITPKAIGKGVLRWARMRSEANKLTAWGWVAATALASIPEPLMFAITDNTGALHQTLRGPDVPPPCRRRAPPA